jgi:hypothetical protein
MAMSRPIDLSEGTAPLRYSVAAVWTPRLAETRFVAIVRGFLENYRQLDPPITNAEALLLVHIVDHKWDEKPPWPGYGTLARRMGTSPQIIQRYIRSLEKKGYLRRERRRRGNAFNLSSLFTALEERVAVGKRSDRPADAGRRIESSCVTSLRFANV